MRELERLLEDAGTGRDFSIPSVAYGSDIDLACLEVQLKMLPDVVASTERALRHVLQDLVKAKKSGGAVFTKMIVKC